MSLPSDAKEQVGMLHPLVIIVQLCQVSKKVLPNRILWYVASSKMEGVLLYDA